MAFDNPTVTFYTAGPECSACVAIEPSWFNITQDKAFGGYNFEKIDIRDDASAAEIHNIDAAPTFLLSGKGAVKKLEAPGADELRAAMTEYLQGKPSTAPTAVSDAVHEFKRDPLPRILLAVVIVAILLFVYRHKKNK